MPSAPQVFPISVRTVLRVIKQRGRTFDKHKIMRQGNTKTGRKIGKLVEKLEREGKRGT